MRFRSVAVLMDSSVGSIGATARSSDDQVHLGRTQAGRVKKALARGLVTAYDPSGRFYADDDLAALGSSDSGDGGWRWCSRISP